jgi:3-methyl-2-oxobutanoate hydroxymethyltransferase
MPVLWPGAGKNTGYVGERSFQSLQIPTIGIGAGNHCDGQVLVMHDMLGINTAFKPRFLRQYLNMAEQIESAVKGYITDIKSGDFPNASESY